MCAEDRPKTPKGSTRAVQAPQDVDGKTRQKFKVGAAGSSGVGRLLRASMLSRPRLAQARRLRLAEA